MVRADEYIQDRPDQPSIRSFKEVKKRKAELKSEGWRVKHRKDADGNFVIFKKHDELLHNSSWRDKARQT